MCCTIEEFSRSPVKWLNKVQGTWTQYVRMENETIPITYNRERQARSQSLTVNDYTNTFLIFLI